MEDESLQNLRWHRHRITLISYFNTLLKSGVLADCTLAAEGKSIKAHKAILCACSPYFEHLLSEHLDKHPILILKDVNFKDLKALVCYMYEGNVDIQEDRVASFIKVAKSLKIKGLTESEPDDTDSDTKGDIRLQGSLAQPLPAVSEIPHVSSGPTIPKISNIPERNVTDVCDTDVPQSSASPDSLQGVSIKEGSQSPVARKKRRRNVEDENLIKNPEASNSREVPHKMGVASPGGGAIGDDKSHSDSEYSFIDSTEDDDTNDSTQDLVGATSAKDNVGAAKKSRESANSSEPEDNDEWNRRDYKKGSYSDSENERIIQYLIKKELIPTADLTNTWNHVAKSKIVNRSARSLRSHFLEYLLSRYKKYTSDNEEACKQFEDLCRVWNITSEDSQVPQKPYKRWSRLEYETLINYIIERNIFDDLTTTGLAMEIKNAKILDREKEAIHKQLKKLFDKEFYLDYVTDSRVQRKIAIGLGNRRH